MVFRGVVATCLVGLIAMSTLVPARADQPRAALVVSPVSSRCTEVGESVPLPPVRVTRQDGTPVAGATVRWRSTDHGRELTSAVAGTDGVASPAQTAVAFRSEWDVVAIATDSSDGTTGTSGAGLFEDGSVSTLGTFAPTGPASFGDRVTLFGVVPLARHVGEGNTCVIRPVEGAVLRISRLVGPDPARGEWEPFATLAVNSQAQWAHSFWADSTGSTTYMLTAQVPGASWATGVGRQAVEVTRERTRMETSVVGVTPLLNGSTVLLRGARHTTRSVLRPSSSPERSRGEEGRVVTIDFTDRLTGRTTRVGSHRVDRLGSGVRLDDRRTATRSGRYTYSFLGSTTEEPSTARLDVRLRPVVQRWPTRRIVVKRSATVRRSVVVKDHEKARAELRVWNPRFRAWHPVGGLRTIDAKGRLTFSVPKVSGTRGYRLVIGDARSLRGGGQEFTALSTTKTWTVTRR